MSVLATQDVLNYILSPGSILSRTIFQLLDNTDVSQLSLTCRSLRRTLSLNGQLCNWLFYHRYLAVHQSLSTYQETLGMSRNQYHERLWTFCSQREGFANQKMHLSEVEQKLAEVFVELLEQQGSLVMMEGLNRSFVDPQPVRPSLRRRTVGEFCRSSIQLKMATEGCEAEQSGNLSEEDQRLKVLFLNQSEEILSQLKEESYQNLLLEIRYRGELLAHFHKTGFLLIDLLQLVLLLTKGYVTAISQLLEIASVSLSPVEFMQEFLSRYCCFKDTVQELDDKFGFFFTTFHHAYEEINPHYPRRPQFSLWRAMMKQWINATSSLLPLAHIAVQLWKHLSDTEIERRISAEISDQESHCSFDHLFVLERFKAKKQEEASFRGVEEETVKVLFQGSVEYLVDISCNAHTVHWLGSAELKLGDSYSLFESRLLQESKDHLHTINVSYSNIYTKVKLAEFFVDSCSQTLKPCTASKTEALSRQFTEETLEHHKAHHHPDSYSELKLWRFPSSSFNNHNERIKSMNQRRQINQETSQHLSPYFSLQYPVLLHEVKQISLLYQLQSNISFQQIPSTD